MTRIRARRPSGKDYVVLTDIAGRDHVHSRLAAAALMREIAEALYGATMNTELVPAPLDGENARPDVLTADV